MASPADLLISPQFALLLAEVTEAYQRRRAAAARPQCVRQALGGRKVFCSWSGGKDSAFALYSAMKDGAVVGPLVTMLTEDGLRSRSHGLRRELLEQQAESIGAPIIFRRATWEQYDVAFVDAVREAVSLGAEDGVFGDLDFNANRAWEEGVCLAAGANAHLPLWHMNRKRYIAQLLAAGFSATVIAVREGTLSADLLGSGVDSAFVSAAARIGIDLAGEGGEYHTVVTDGPIFKRRLRLLRGEAVRRDGMVFLDVRSS